jgi:hypothetical protein
MAMKFTTVPTKRIETKVGESGADIQDRTAQAGREPRSPVEKARNSVFSTWDEKQRRGFAEAGHPEWYGQRNFAGTGEDYKPAMPMSEVPLDIAKSAVSGAVTLPETLIGQLGDIPDMRYDLARFMNRKLSGMPGGNSTANRAINLMQKYDPLHYLPHTEQVAGSVTDPLLEAMGTTAQDWGRYQPQSPWGGAAYLAPNAVDPLTVGGKGARAVSGLFRKAVR